MEKNTTTYGVKNYRNGLSIGGGSGNLFWKGDRVVTGSAAALGSATKPVYLSAGRLYACNDTLDVGISGVAAKATILETARTIHVNLASTTAASFNGSVNVSPGVTGTLPIANGGTGATTATGVLTNLGITATAAELNKLDGVTATTTELNYIDGVTSNIQTQLNAKLPNTTTYAGSSSVGGSATSAEKVNTNLIIKLNSGTTEGTNLFTFNGSTAKTIDVTPTAIGAYTKTEIDTKLSNLSITNATNATNVYVNNTTAATKYYVVGSSLTSAGNSALYRAYNTSGSSNTAGVYFQGSTGVLYGAAWNDYAEFRKTEEKIEPGRVVVETGKGDLVLSTERLQPGAEIVSDTFGFAIGETDECQTPIAATGRVLAYPYEDRNSYQAGDAVCAGPNGTVSKMTEEEICKYPHRIIGTVSEIPDYETWGQSQIKVNNRIWIRIR